MAISVDDYPTTQSQIVSFFRNRLPGKDDHSESWIGKLARCVAMAIWGFKQAAIAIDNDAVPSNKTSDAGMAVWANAVGVPNGQGGYGPLTAQPASGGAGNCTGTNGTVYPAGALLYAPDGVTLIQLVNSVSIPGSPPGTGSVLGTFAAVTPGTVGNIAAGSVLTWASAPSGSDPTVTLSTGLTNGIDVETTPQLYGRVAARMQKPPKGGAEVDYASWAIAAPQAQGSSVNRGYPYPGRGGLGTVHLLITQQGSGAGRVPSTAMQTAVTNYIVGTSSQQGVRPCTCEGYKTLLPYTATVGLVPKLRVIPSSSKYAFDWSSGQVSMNALSWNGAANQLTLTAPAPVALQNAVRAGKNPLIQVFGILSGSTVPSTNPPPTQVTAIDATNTILTLQNPQPGNFITPVLGAEVVYPAIPRCIAYSASGGAGGAPMITLESAAPGDLVAKVKAGLAPRIQVFSANVLFPQGVQVTSVDTTNTQLTLQSTLPFGWIAPAASNGFEAVFSYGPVVAPVAAAIRAYVDGLGASRMSGYADPTDPWEDTCSVTRLAQIALDQLDTDGITRLAINLAMPARVGGVSSDVQAQDNASGIELLYCGAIIVGD